MQTRKRRRVRKQLPPGVVRTQPLSVQIPEFFDPVMGHAVALANAREEGSGRMYPAGEPPDPMEPSGSAPRALVPTPYINTSGRPRTWPGVPLTPFEQLRSLARFDLVRIAMRDVKGQILGMCQNWDISVRKEFADQATALDDQVQAARRFVERPDPLADLELEAWVNKVLEEVLVTDALSLYPRLTFGGEPIGLEQIDGATIKPLVDDLGRPPAPPDPAFMQYVHGHPETEFIMPVGEPSSAELWYMPYERLPNTPYGFSPTEQVVMTVNLALRHQLHDLSYYVSGNLPDSLYTVPSTWNRQQTEEFQAYFDALLEGRTDRRSGGLRFVPDGKYIATKTRDFKYEFVEWLARVIAWAFGVSPMPIAKVMNRATAESMEESTLESGVRPIAQFLARILNRYIHRILQIPEVEFQWGSDEVEDGDLVQRRNVAYVHGGIRTLNAVRKDIGEDPYPEEYGDRAFVMTPSGPLFLDTIEEERQEKKRRAEEFAARLGGGAKKPGGEEDNGDGDGETPTSSDDEDGDGDDDEPVIERLHRYHLDYRARVLDDLGKFGRMVRNCNRRGRPIKSFVSTCVPPSILEKSMRGDFRDLYKAEGTLTAAQRDVESKLETLILAWFDTIKDDVIEWAEGFLEKVDVPPLGGEDELAAALAEILGEAFTAGASDVIGSLGLDLTTPSESALLYAQDRAAELVGKKWVNGVLIDNPNPEFAITETLRSDINTLVNRGISDGWSPQRMKSELEEIGFGSWRAKTIARTETGFAYGNGAAMVYEESDVQYVLIQDGAGCLPTGHKNGAPAGTGAAGTVETANEANNQVWTVGQYQARVLGHPNCVRGAVPYFPEE